MQLASWMPCPGCKPLLRACPLIAKRQELQLLQPPTADMRDHTPTGQQLTERACCMESQLGACLTAMTGSVPHFSDDICVRLQESRDA